MQIDQLKRTSDINYQEFVEEYFEKQPVVITNKISHWPALKKWTPEYFKNRYSQETIYLMDCRASTKLTYLESHIQHDLIKTRMGEFVDMLNRGEQGYAIAESIDFMEEHEELLDDMDQYRPFHCTEEPEASRYMALWFSPKDSLTGLHIDKGEGHLFQLYGTKIVRLFGPDQTKYLYEDDIEKLDALEVSESITKDDLDLLKNYVRFSKVNPFSPNYEDYPLFETAKGLEVVIKPGDVLYIPMGWWHTVKSLETSISVSKSLYLNGFLKH
jgi:lysine-specific demethylase 8